MKYQELHDMFYAAFLKAIHSTGDSYKQLSWFAKNKPKAAVAYKPEEIKKAA